MVKTFTPPAFTTAGVGKVRLKGYHSLSSGPGSRIPKNQYSAFSRTLHLAFPCRVSEEEGGERGGGSQKLVTQKTQ